MQAWGRLLRVALAPTVLADIAAGIVLGAGTWPAGGLSAVWLLCATLAVYHGAMVLNDWADRDWDAKTRPDRPLPSGSVTPRAALAVALVLLFAAPFLAWLSVASHASSPSGLACVGSIALALILAVAYDLGPRGPFLGPLLLAGCRACNLAAGCFWGINAWGMHAVSASGATTAHSTRLALLVVPAYGAYVFIVSRLGRLEDGEDGESLERLPARYLRRLAVLLVGVGSLAVLRAFLVAGTFPVGAEWWPLALGLCGAWELWRRAGKATWTQPDVVAAMGCALRRLLVLTACIALLATGPQAMFVAGLILCGFPVSYLLRRAFPPS